MKDYKKLAIEKFFLSGDELKLVAKLVSETYRTWEDVYGYEDIFVCPGYNREQLIQELCELDPNKRTFDDMDKIAEYVDDEQRHWIDKDGIIEFWL